MWNGAIRFLRLIFVAVLCSFPLFAATNVSLLSESARLGITVFWDSLSGSGMLEKSGHQISFRADNPFVLKDFKSMEFADAPVVRDGTVFVTRKFIEDIDRFFRQDESNDDLYRIGAILIDAGHGGKDPGAHAFYKIDGKETSVLEKDINLATAKLLYARL